MSQVSLTRCPTYESAELRAAVDRLLEPFGGLAGASGFGRRIGPGSRVLVKPNFLRAATAEEAVSPHPELVREICRRLLGLGAQVTIGDSPAFGTARGVAQLCGVMEVAQELGIPVVEFRKPQAIRTGPPSNLTLQLDREVLEADAVVNLCKLKSHQQTGMTGAVKNLFGCITGKRKPLWHLRLGDRGNGFGEMLVEVYRNVAPVLSICDGILAMEGNGPGLGTPREVGVLLAAEDGVALDTVAASLVGYPPEELRVWQAAVALGVGTPRLKDISVVGDTTLESVQLTDWKRPEPLPIFFNPARVAWSSAKQAVLLARMKAGERFGGSHPPN